MDPAWRNCFSRVKRTSLLLTASPLAAELVRKGWQTSTGRCLDSSPIIATVIIGSPTDKETVQMLSLLMKSLTKPGRIKSQLR